ncbi:MAG: hypothetical protein H3C32_12405 [Anaerolineae bacterium]|nr:MAG: hypothetical protein UZ13_02064 [Chloroflexi bacterium OLB13]MBW7880100.1 hypothetical protein [Anaerolineae bacterium]
MTRLHFASIFMALVCCLAAFGARRTFHAQDIYGYAYVYQTHDGEVGITIADPILGTMRTISVNDGENAADLINAAPSVGHEWVAVVLGENNQRIVKLANIITSEVHEIGRYTVPIPSALLFGPPQDVVWSPNGMYLAFNIGQRSADGFTITSTSTVIYSIQENSVIDLSREGTQSTRLAWSNDSRYLTVASFECRSECVARLDQYDITTKGWSSSIVLDPEVRAASEAGMCYLAWSPDDTYISFVANCDGALYAYYKEVYLVDVTQGSVRRLTDFTYRQDIEKQQGFLVIAYNTTWLNHNALFISAVHGVGVERIAETFVYHPSTGEESELFSGFTPVVGWNAQSNVLAYQIGSRSREYFGALTSVGAANVSATRSSIADQLNIPLIDAPVCDLNWSPDGAILAYMIPYVTDTCGVRAKQIQFLHFDSAGSQPLPWATDLSGIRSNLPIGWVPTR